MTTWGESIWGVPASAAVAIPIAPTDAVGRLEWLLRYNVPGLSGTTLSATRLWTFGDGVGEGRTDLVGGAVLANTGVDFTDHQTAPDTSVNLESPLNTGFGRWIQATDKLQAAAAGVMDIVTSSLIITALRVPVPTLAGIEAIWGKREAGGANVGMELSMNVDGHLITTADYGAAATIPIFSPTHNITGMIGSGLGIWRVVCTLVDSGRGVMVSTSTNQTAWFDEQTGGLTSTAVWALGSTVIGKQALPMDVALVAQFDGAQIEGLFHNRSEDDTAAGGTNDPSGATIRDVSSAVWNDMFGAVNVDPHA